MTGSAGPEAGAPAASTNPSAGRRSRTIYVLLGASGLVASVWFALAAPGAGQPDASPGPWWPLLGLATVLLVAAAALADKDQQTARRRRRALLAEHFPEALKPAERFP